MPVGAWAFGGRMQLAIDEKETVGDITTINLITADKDKNKYISTLIASVAWAASFFLSILLPSQPYLNAILE